MEGAAALLGARAGATTMGASWSKHASDTNDADASAVLFLLIRAGLASEVAPCLTPLWWTNGDAALAAATARSRHPAAAA